MGTSQKQIEANRQNALRSTGPKTPAGKARSAMNARTHGLLAQEAVNPAIDSEADCAEFAQLDERYRAWYQPVGPVEEMLVDKITIATWRLKKALRYELAGAYREYRNDQPDGYAAICAELGVGGRGKLGQEVGVRTKLLASAGINVPTLASL